ncbi:MAG: ABC transporter ATP-binding protein/permease [Clostridia bacterium]|nr:ABC transporter ATP-binding protein/permease [Clostridia bacterium]
MKNANTPKKEQNRFSALVASFGKYRIKFVISILLLIVSTVLVIIAPSQIQALTNVLKEGAEAVAEGTGTVDLVAIGTIGLTLVAIYLVSFGTGAASENILNTAIQRYSKDLRESIVKKINRIPLGYYNDRPTGDILSIITNDVDTLGTSLQNGINTLLYSVVMIVGVVIAMFISSPVMALVVLVSVPLIAILLSAIVKLAMPLFDKNQKYLGSVNTVTEENFSGQIIIKAFNAEKLKGKQFSEENKALGKVLFLSQLIGGLIQPLMNFISYITYAAVLIVGGILFVEGKIDFGTITAFLVYVGLFQEPLAQIGQASNTLQLAGASSGRVFEFLNAKEMTDETQKPLLLDHNDIKGQVEFKDICFGYRTNELFVKHFSKVITPGMKVAVVGPSGAGKSTLVNLLMRFYELNSGDILIDGVSIKDMSRTELRTLFGMILQETWVMNGTLRENLVYNIKDYDEKRIDKILEDTGLAHFVSTLPNGLDTEIQGQNALSSGQQQLVTIARAMIEDAPMMILDEATSNVDTRTEQIISRALDTLMEGRTSFVIAHRLSTIRNADLILVMKDGDIVETGTHDSLIAEGGLYSEIYNAQFG